MDFKELEEGDMEDCLSIGKRYFRNEKSLEHFKERIRKSLNGKNKTYLLFERNKIMLIAITWSNKNGVNVSVYSAENNISEGTVDFFIEKIKENFSKQINIYVNGKDFFLLHEFLSKGIAIESKHIIMTRSTDEVMEVPVLPLDFKVVEVGDAEIDDYLECYKKASEKSAVAMDAWTKESFAKAMHDEKRSFEAIKNEGEKFVAVIDYSISGEKIKINNVLTLFQYRHKGLATLLILLAMKKGKKQGAKTAEIGVNNKNKPAYNLYKKLGFAEKRIAHYKLVLG